MKNLKLLCSVVASALLVVGCSQNEVDEKSLSQRGAIGFENLNNVPSRVANDSASDYGVFVVDAGDNYYSTMENLLIDGVTNEYTPNRFWPGTDLLNFYAYAPHAPSSSLTTGATKNDVTTVFTVGANADVDFTVATPVATAKPTGSNTVSFSFNHMLAKIQLGTVTLSPVLQNAGVTINADAATISLFVPKNSGTHSVTDPVASWTNLTPTTVTSSTKYADKKAYYVIPQILKASPVSTVAGADVDAVRIQLKNVLLDQNDGQGPKVYNLIAQYVASGNAGFSGPGTAFDKGKQYTVNFVIGGAAETGDPTDNGGGENPDGGGDPIFNNTIQFDSNVVNWVDEPWTYSTGD